MGDEAESASKKTGILSSAFGGMIAQFVGFAAIGSTIIGTFKEIAAEALRAATAVKEVGDATRGLSANIGGRRAQQIFGQVTTIAAENRFSVAGRAQLLEGVSALTDAQPNLNNTQIVASARNLALLQRATGVGGKQGFSVVQSLQANVGLSESQAVDTAASLLNSGFDASAVEDIVSRGGNVGGLEFVALASAARQTGLAPGDAGRALPTLIGALNQRDERGNLASSLTSLGITEDQTLTQRLAFLDAQRAAGAISQGAFEKATGGAQNARIVAPLTRALQQGLLAPELAALTDPNSAENAVAAILQNQYVRAAERANVRELGITAGREQSALTPVGEELQAESKRTEGLPGWIRAASFIGNLPNLIFPDDPEADASRTQTIINNTIINNNPIFHGEDPTTSDSGRRALP